MGIKRFNDFGRSMAPDAYTTISVEKFRGKRIAIDGYSFVYSRMFGSNAASYRGVNLKLDPMAKPDEGERNAAWYTSVIEFTITLMSFGITPVFVFDGPNVPGKEKCRAARRDDKKKTMKKIDALTEELNGMSVLDRDDKSVEKLKSMKSSVTYVAKDQVDHLVNILECIGIPTLRAYGDGENLCCALAHEGLVAGVYSSDTDCIAMGCPILITGITKGSKRYGMTFDVVIFDKIFRELELTYAQYVDLCIMGKCDYNENIKGIGMHKAYNLIKTYGSIEEIGKVRDIACLEHEFCREVFRSRPSHELLGDEYLKVETPIGSKHGNVLTKKLPCLNVNYGKLHAGNVRSLLGSVGVDGMKYHTLIASSKNITKLGNSGAESVLSEGRIIVSNNGSVPIRIIDAPEATAGLTIDTNIIKALAISSGAATPPVDNVQNEPMMINPVDPLTDMLRIE